MARNTAEFSSRHRDDYEDEQLEQPSKDPAAAYTDFINHLDERHPDLARALDADHHPLSAEHSAQWLDPDKREAALAHVRMSFEDATSDLDHDTRYAVAGQLADKLTAPITYPIKLMAETYAQPAPDHVSDNVQHYADTLNAASQQAFERINEAKQEMTFYLAEHDHHAHYELADYMAYIQERFQDTHLDHITDALMQPRPSSMDHDQQETHAKALGQALSYPIQTNLEQHFEDRPSPFDHYRLHLLESTDPNDNRLTDVADLAYRLDRLDSRAYDTAENRLERITENLVHDISHTEHGFTEIRQALTDLQHLDQTFDYRPNTELANDMKQAFEEAVTELGSHLRNDIARYFSQAIVWPLREQLQEANQSPDDSVRALAYQLTERTTNQEKDLVLRMASGEYDSDNIRFTMEGITQSQKELSQVTDPSVSISNESLNP